MRPVTLFTLAFTLSSALVQAGTCRVKDYGLPKCAKTCFRTAQNQTTTCPTDHIDLACLCGQAEVQKQIDSCLTTSCQGTDGAAAEYGNALCAAAAANATKPEVSATPSASAEPTASASASEEWSATILPISESASASIPAQEDIAFSSAAASFSDAPSSSEAPASSDASSPTSLAPPPVALAQAKDEPVVTITTNAASSPSEAADAPGSTGGAGKLVRPGWIVLGIVGISTWVAL